MANPLPHNGLRILSIFFKVIAWLAVGIGLIGTIGIVLGGGAPQTPRIAGLAVLAVSALYFCLFWALSGIIQLLLAIEAQTRKTS